MMSKHSYVFTNLIVGVCLSFNSCVVNTSSSTSEEQVVEETKKEEVFYVPDYRLIDESRSTGFVEKIEYIVRIYSELDKEQLELVAKHIYSTKRPKYDLIFISYYLPSQQVGAGSWGMTEIRNRYFTTQVNGTPKKDIPQAKISDDAQILGKWTNHLLGGEYVIYEKNNRLFFKCSFSDGSELENELIKRQVNGVTRYYDKEDDEPLEYYVIKDGSLYMYDIWDSLGGVYHP